MSLKKHVALTVLGLSAAGLSQAQSSANLYGVVDLAFGSFQYSALKTSTTDGKHITKVDPNNMVTSFIGLKGVEDLGEGLKAGFVLESFLRPDTGASGRFDNDPFWGRASNVYLQSASLGKLTVGRQANLPYLQVVGFNPFAGAFGLSPAVRLTYGKWGNDKGDSGWSNAVTYTAPTMAGVTAAVQLQPGEATDGSEALSHGLAVGYSAGPLALAASTQRLRSNEAPKAAGTIAAGQQQTFSLLNASYDAGVLKAFVELGRFSNKGYTANAQKISTNLFQLGVSVPLSKEGKLLASWGSSTEKANGGGTTPKTRHDIGTFAYDHFLSKRTDVYAAYMFDNEKLSTFQKGNSYLVGVRHAF
jgi:predicted porin